MARVTLTGILRRTKIRKRRGDWMKDFGALLNEQEHPELARYYPETVGLGETGMKTKRGDREMNFCFNRAPKALAGVLHGERVTITATVEWWENGMGAYLTRPKLVPREVCTLCQHKHCDPSGTSGCWACPCGHPPYCPCQGCLEGAGQ